MKRVLVLTAGFGEGHNTAARSVREALEVAGGAEVLVGDLYANAAPGMNATVKVGYSIAINRAPWIWRLIFLWLDRPGWMEGAMWTTGALRKELERLIDEFRPDIIVSTYPLYAYLFRRIQKSRLGVRMPIVTVVTDSIGVNSAWHRCLSDAFIVADSETEQLLVSRGVPKEIVHPLGFPVAHYFAKAAGQPVDSRPPWKLLFMPSTQVRLTLRQIEALTELPGVELTVVAGKHERIFDAVKESGLLEGGKGSLIGWTDAMPRLLCEHHVFIGKAGGAIVQEAIAARCPFVVSHLVPGQEEGNIELIERLDVGAQALGKPEHLAAVVAEAFADDARVWRGWKQNLEKLDAADSAGRIARFLLEFKK
jgi:processive 1,2-diacylglycerol beta-glucosyltransferase